MIFKIERIDIPETPEEEEWLSKQDFLVRYLRSLWVVLRVITEKAGFPVEFNLIWPRVSVG